MSTSVLHVAAHILDKHGPMTHMKLQKLCYYSQAWHLAWDGVPMFPEKIEAWANGPIIPVLYEALRGEFEVDSQLLAERLADESTRAAVNARLQAEDLAPLAPREPKGQAQPRTKALAAVTLALTATIAIAARLLIRKNTNR